MRNIKIHFCISNAEANALKLALHFTQETDKSPKIFTSEYHIPEIVAQELNFKMKTSKEITVNSDIWTL